MITTLGLIAVFELFLYLKKSCLLKAAFFSLFGAGLAWFLLKQLGFALPVTEGTALFSALLGLPGVFLMNLCRFFLTP